MSDDEQSLDQYLASASPAAPEIGPALAAASCGPGPLFVAPPAVALSVVAPVAQPGSSRETTLRERRRFFDALVDELKGRYGIGIRKWRSRMTGVAYEIRYRDGSVRRYIAAPRPRSPVSASIFLHEVGHHAVGFRKFRPRCLEEFKVWEWTFEQMRQRQIPIDARVLKHYRRSMYHYVRMARRRGLKQVPVELEPFIEWPG